MDENGRDITCLDPIATAALKAANISRDMLPSLSKEDLRDLLPGPEHFRRRRTIWRLNHDENEGQETDLCRPSTSHGTCDFSPIPTPQPSLFPSSSSSCPNPSPSPVFSPPSFSSQSPQPQHGASRTVQLPSPLYVLYTDTELEQSRSTFSEKQRAGEEGDYVLSKDLRCRLIRNTVTSMLSIKRAAGDDFNYPCSRELTVMAKRLIEYYPMLRDRSQTSRAEWETVKKQLLKRVQNVTTPKKKQGSTPSRKRPRSLSFQSSHETSTDETDESTASTLILERSPPSRCSTPEAEQLCASETESPQTQARHYKTLQAMYKTKARPNKMDVAQLLDLEIQARRAFIDSDVTKEQDRPSKILKAYPCFGELDHLMDELRRVLNQGNSHFLTELKTRWGTFCERAQFYGVFKKLMRPPQLDKVKHSIAMMKALPEMFPSPMAPPKKLRHASEALLHVLESAEDPNTFLQTRPLSSPVVIICETNCILAIGTMPVLIFPKEDIHESVMYLMACYYTFHLTYPKCIATLLSVVQTEVLLDAIHDCDMTTSYKKAMADWKKFISD
ncbi:uncharacterized protein LOC117552575 [Gymnodraco acuticeps]|uniref:Uncharacterized protein LOC117552575 n=1 Tax=Gymnodraco acuticeps TaxID=8218 RepID=A0A6P8W367_GYMAC|nr:uncharacterized protein LOC117552575 [Gymnodraco acuticeps]